MLHASCYMLPHADCLRHVHNLQFSVLPITKKPQNLIRTTFCCFKHPIGNLIDGLMRHLWTDSWKCAALAMFANSREQQSEFKCFTRRTGGKFVNIMDRSDYSACHCVPHTMMGSWKASALKAYKHTEHVNIVAQIAYKMCEERVGNGALIEITVTYLCWFPMEGLKRDNKIIIH